MKNNLSENCGPSLRKKTIKGDQHWDDPDVGTGNIRFLKLIQMCKGKHACKE